MKRLGPGLILALILGFAFLYLPIVTLIAYSFNASRLVTVWGGFSTHWYGALMANEPLLDAAWLSIDLTGGEPACEAAPHGASMIYPAAVFAWLISGACDGLHGPSPKSPLTVRRRWRVREEPAARGRTSSRPAGRRRSS